MPADSGRYQSPSHPQAARGWSLKRITPPSRLHGANGLTTGADGRIYVAQVAGSQVSAINVDSGAIETICAMGGDIVAPDDLVFDDAGNLYLTEITRGQVSMRTPSGEVRVIQGDMPVANPITWHEGRLFAGECRIGARIMELDRNGGAPRVILDNVPMANAFQVGPDGQLYFPVMGTNEIWRVSLSGGAPEVVAGNLGLPDSVKFDSKGRIVTTQAASGEVLRLDLVSGTREILAKLGPGLDNVTFIGERIFVSSLPGEITEIIARGETRSVLPRALQWPLGLAVGDDGTIFVADGALGYTLRPGGALALAGMIFYPGCPGYMRGVVAGSQPGEWIVTTGQGAVARYRPALGESDVLCQGYDQLMGIDVAPDGTIVFAEYGAGRVLCIENGGVTEIAAGLDKPMGIAIAPDGSIFVAEAGAGRVVKLSAGKSETVLDGLARPEGLAITNGRLFVVDTRARALLTCDQTGGDAQTLLSGLPVGLPTGVHLRPPLSVGDLAGPMVNFSDIAIGPDGSVYLSADAEGSIWSARALPVQQGRPINLVQGDYSRCNSPTTCCLQQG